MTLRLYSYFRSSCSYRVRIALGLKELAYEYVPVHLLQDGGQQYAETYLARNPLGEVPTLEVCNDSGEVLTTLSQSVAILEFLEEQFPAVPLLPQEPAARGRVRQIVEIVNSSIQPIQNLKVMRRLQEQFAVERDVTLAWSRHWIERGFQGLEALLQHTAGAFAFGDTVSLADVMLVPQEYNARRFQIDMNRFPTIQRVCAAANQISAFQAAAPERQPDTPDDLLT